MANIVLFGETVLVNFKDMLADKHFEVGCKIRTIEIQYTRVTPDREN
jgi:hypothetical protein